MLNIGFKSMLTCAVAGIVCLTLPALLLNSLVGLGWIAFAYTLWVLILGFILSTLMYLEYIRQNKSPKRDEKGRFVKSE